MLPNGCLALKRTKCRNFKDVQSDLERSETFLCELLPFGPTNYSLVVDSWALAKEQTT